MGAEDGFLMLIAYCYAVITFILGVIVGDMNSKHSKIGKWSCGKEALMLFEVDFSIKINGYFQTVHKEFIFAESVSECQDKAESIREELPQNKHNHLHIFIEDMVGI
jgi:hypothetical protein